MIYTNKKSSAALVGRSALPADDVLLDRSLSVYKNITPAEDLQAVADRPDNEVLEKFTPKRQKSVYLADIYEYLGLKEKRNRARFCGSYLEFKVPINGQTEEDKKARLSFANFCKIRLCPMCSWRKSLRLFGQASDIMTYIESHNFGVEYIFLTFTVKNVPAGGLKGSIDDILQGFRKLTHNNKDLQAVNLGTFRTLEITHNPYTDTWHPHIHMVMAVDKSYFHSRHYMSQRQWSAEWRKCMSLDYDPIVNVQKVRGTKADLLEVTKYATKDSDYLDLNDFGRSVNNVQVLDGALHNRQLVAYTGLFRQRFKALKCRDIEDTDLLYINEEPIRADLQYMIVKYYWSMGVGGLGYYEKQIEKENPINE